MTFVKKRILFLAAFVIVGVLVIGSCSPLGNRNVDDSDSEGSTINEKSDQLYVDLGLPSGLLWGTRNIGATSQEDYGSYYAWGEVSEKSAYNKDNYAYAENPAELPSDDDIAAITLGRGWRMPTKADFDELKANCKCERYTLNKVKGCLVTGPNGNSIFFPAAGYYFDTHVFGLNTDCYYWSSSLMVDHKEYAWVLYLGSSAFVINMYDRHYGRPVRPVFQR